jgi:hypothetical protein
MAAAHLDTLRGIAKEFDEKYKSTPTKLKLLDLFCVCALATAALQVRVHDRLRPRANLSNQGLVIVDVRPSEAARHPCSQRQPSRPCHRLLLRTHKLTGLPLRPQFVYAKLVGTFPFNAFLAGFFCCVGTFVLTLSLRMKVSASGGESGPQEFGGYALAMCTLFIASWNYIG